MRLGALTWQSLQLDVGGPQQVPPGDHDGFVDPPPTLHPSLEPHRSRHSEQLAEGAKARGAIERSERTLEGGGRLVEGGFKPRGEERVEKAPHFGRPGVSDHLRGGESRD